MSPTHRHAAGHSNLGSAVERQGRAAPGQRWGDCGKDRGEDSGLLKWYLTWAHRGATVRGRILSGKPWAPVTDLQEGTHGTGPGRTADPGPAQGEPWTRKPEQPGPQKAPQGCGTDHPARQKYPRSLQDASKALHLTALRVQCL